MTLGNLPKSLRRKPSEHACICIGYLSVDKVDAIGLSEKKQRALVQQLFHASVRMIVKPLIEAGRNGIDVTGGDGKVRRVYPVLASYVCDYPEQCLITCSKYGTCPVCQCPDSKLEDDAAKAPRTSLWTLDVLRKAKAQGPKGSAPFYASCKELNVSGYVVTPFWKGLPHTNIHGCVTPDVLHQLYQGVFKHILEWCQEAMDASELDARIRCLPPAFGTRHFKNGISALSQVSGSERKDIARILLGCLVGRIPHELMLTFRSLLDFIYISQYPTHDDITLSYLEDALKVYHKNKKILKTLGIRTHMNIPKFHSLLHYVESIRSLGTTDNYNTEMFERLHIDCAKKAWRASNHRNERPQMVRWLERQEKMAMYESMRERLYEEAQEHDCQPDTQRTAGFGSSGRGALSRMRRSRTKVGIVLAKHPSVKQQGLGSIAERHCAPGFSKALSQYVYKLKLGRPLNTAELAQAPSYLPFARLDIFHGVKFTTVPLSDSFPERDAVKARPACGDQPARFDTAVVLQGDDAEATGLQGMRSSICYAV